MIQAPTTNTHGRLTLKWRDGGIIANSPLGDRGHAWSSGVARDRNDSVPRHRGGHNLVVLFRNESPGDKNLLLRLRGSKEECLSSLSLSEGITGSN